MDTKFSNGMVVLIVKIGELLRAKPATINATVSNIVIAADGRFGTVSSGCPHSRHS